MAKIIDVPYSLRPREKAIREGIHTLSYEELLCLLLCSGTIHHPVLHIARDICNIYPSIYHLSRATYHDLIQIKGVSKARALSILSMLECIRRFEESLPKKELPFQEASDFVRYYKKRFSSSLEEVIFIIYLQNDYTIYQEEVLEKGECGHVKIHQKKLLKHLFLSRMHSFILIHNHPSGNVNPSQTDIFNTLELKALVHDFGFTLLDHIIIGGNAYYSFKKEGLI